MNTEAESRTEAEHLAHERTLPLATLITYRRIRLGISQKRICNTQHINPKAFARLNNGTGRLCSDQVRCVADYLGISKDIIAPLIEADMEKWRAKHGIGQEDPEPRVLAIELGGDGRRVLTDYPPEMVLAI